MTRRIRENVDNDIPKYLYQATIEYVEFVCDCCHETTDILYEYDGRELCENCLKEAARIAP